MEKRPRKIHRTPHFPARRDATSFHLKTTKRTAINNCDENVWRGNNRWRWIKRWCSGITHRQRTGTGAEGGRVTSAPPRSNFVDFERCSSARKGRPWKNQISIYLSMVEIEFTKLQIFSVSLEINGTTCRKKCIHPIMIILKDSVLNNLRKLGFGEDL